MYWRKSFLALVVAVLTGLGIYVNAQTKSFVWDSNGEPDMKEYVVVICPNTPCTIGAPQAQQTIVEHMTGNATHVLAILPGSQGYAVVYARDKSGNLSLPSNELAFDTTAPLAPKNFRIQ